MTKKVISANIIDAAKKEFQKRGYNETSVEDIIEAAGISADEFLECFDDKEACCKKVLKVYEKEVKNTLSKLDEQGNPRQRLSLYLDGYIESAETLAEQGDPILNLYYDLRNMDNAIVELVEGLLKLQHMWIDEQFIIMLKANSAVDQGDRLMAAVCGLLLVSKLSNDPAMLKNQIIQLKSWIRTM